MSSVISFTSVSRWFGDVIALNDISLNIEGGITGLLGPNGAGKSTFINLVTGRLKPSKGRVTILGENPLHNYKLTRFYGFVPEQDAYYERLTGLEFMTYMARLHGFDKRGATRLSMELLERHGLINHQNKPVAAYSKGMRQRIKLAQALIHDPEVIFLDEPLNGMDPVGRAETIDLIKTLGKQGKTVIVSSHILFEVEAMTQQIVLINNGRILAEGQVDEIRGLIDEYPHNVIIYSDRLRELATVFVNLPDVVDMHIKEDQGFLKVQSREPENFYHTIVKIAVEDGFNITRIESPDDNLQSVFKYLVK
ncbi:MAG: ABC transporter ATP-binding protein [Acidobacteria bacterium]|nr:ABC transporter ATP-binding protein [Acidobacteriota bacterium]